MVLAPAQRGPCIWVPPSGRGLWLRSPGLLTNPETSTELPGGGSARYAGPWHPRRNYRHQEQQGRNRRSDESAPCRHDRVQRHRPR